MTQVWKSSYMFQRLAVHSLILTSFIIILIIIMLSLFGIIELSFASSRNEPFIRDNDLVAELVFNGTTINGISNMAIIDSNDFLILDRTEGTVNRIINGAMVHSPLLDVTVSDPDGLLGIATLPSNNSHTYVFLYYTKAPIGYGMDIRYRDNEQKQSINSSFGYIRECNCLYRYELVDNKLVNPVLILSLPAHPGGDLHHGGEIKIGPDDNIYLTIGNLEGENELYTKAQNFVDGVEPDGRGGILRVTQDGKPVASGILGEEYPTNLYYAYGIRNSFGIAFDPITYNLWDTENGPDFGDEINLVEPGFNSGGDYVYGMSASEEGFDLNKLSDFEGKGRYSDPELTWAFPVAPTAILFLNSDKLGTEYENDMFVADVNYGNVYHFELNEDRSDLSLEGFVKDKIVDNQEELASIVFAEFGSGITDMQIGPDGYLYVLAGKGKNTLIYRVLPVDDAHNLNVTNQDRIGKVDEILSDELAAERALIKFQPSLIRGNGSVSKIDNNTLMISMEKGNGTSWDKVSTDYIPIRHETPYKYNLNISAKDVNQLHSKVYYYDSNKTELNWDFVFHGKDGTFENTYSDTLITPSNAAYAKVQMWVLPNPEKESYYLLDNPTISAKKSLIKFQPSLIRGNGSVSKIDNNTLMISMEKGNGTSWDKVSTDYIPVSKYTPYKYNLNISAKDVNQLHSKVYYYDSNKTELNWDFVFHGKDGTFENTYSDTLITPSNAAYAKVQMWVLPNPEKESYYTISETDRDQLMEECYLGTLYPDPFC